MTLPLVIDSTIISTFRACEVKARYQYVEHLAPSTLSIDLHAGSAFAAGLEALYEAAYERQWDRLACLGYAEAALEAAWGSYEIPEWKETNKTLDRMVEALFSYARHYDPPNDHVKPLPGAKKPWEWSFGIPLTEETTGLRMPLHPSGDPFIYAGRFDLLGEYLNMTVVRDDKTTSQFSKNWLNSWSLRAQFMGYCWAMQQVGLPLECVIVRGVKILKESIQHQEAEKRFPTHLIQQWLLWLQRNLELFVHAEASGYWHPSFGTECTSYGGCAFHDLCTSPEPDRWKADFDRRTWNPLVRGA